MKKIQLYVSFVTLIILMSLVSCNSWETKSNIKVEEGYKSINGTEIFYKIMGEGEPLIILHGGPVLDHGYLVPFLKPLAKKYKLIYFDQRLSGRSSADVDTSDVHLEQFVDDIEYLRKSLNINTFHLAAHSWGGLLAMNYAIKYPENLQSLVLFNSIPASSELWEKEGQILAQKVSKEDSIKRQEILNSELFKTNTPKAIEQLLILSFRNQFFEPSLADSLDFYIPEDYMIRSQRFGNISEDISSYDLHPALSSLEIPTLLIYGEIEPATSLSASELNKTIPNSKLSIIPKSGHFPFVEQPDKFISEVHDFIKAN